MTKLEFFFNFWHSIKQEGWTFSKIIYLLTHFTQFSRLNVSSVFTFNIYSSILYSIPTGTIFWAIIKWFKVSWSKPLKSCHIKTDSLVTIHIKKSLFFSFVWQHFSTLDVFITNSWKIFSKIIITSFSCCADSSITMIMDNASCFSIVIIFQICSKAQRTRTSISMIRELWAILTAVTLTIFFKCLFKFFIKMRGWGVKFVTLRTDQPNSLMELRKYSFFTFGQNLLVSLRCHLIFEDFIGIVGKISAIPHERL